jgi:transposase
MLKSGVLDKAYIKERNAPVKERLLLIIRIPTDKQHIELVAKELHKSRAWTYTWYKRYNEDGLEGLRETKKWKTLLYG